MKPIPPVTCPTCKKKGRWFDGEFGPFCSRKCRLIDLGAWFDEERRIESPLRPDHFRGFDDLPPGPHLDVPSEDS